MLGVMASPPFVAELDTLIRARTPLVWILTAEEERAEAALGELAERHGKALLGWSITRGFRRLGGSKIGPVPDGSRQPLEALQVIERLPEASIVLLEDFHPFLSEPAVVRAARDLAHALRGGESHAMILSPVLAIPPELEKEITVVDVPLPTFHDLLGLLKEVVTGLRQGGRAPVELTPTEAEQLIQAARGLTLGEARSALAKAVALDGKLGRADIALVLEEKRQAVRKGGLLEYFATDASLTGVGGLDLLKRWLERRAAAFGEEAHRFGLPEPKGLLLLGVQGCGKSLTAKAIAASWRLPLLRLDLGRIFSGLVGSSEENLRRAIRSAESLAPAVLWIDEIEKGLSGVASSGASDGGVTARIFGALLTWLQEKTAPVFVVATANQIDQLPPELLRQGRFDETFFIDLPAAGERHEILRIHLTRLGRDPKRFDLDALAAAAAGLSGAELEQALVTALHEAFAERTDLEPRHLARAIAETRPLSITMAEEIDRLRDWAAARTRPASSETPPARAGAAPAGA